MKKEIHSNQDFLIENLPHNYKELFFDRIKQYLRPLLGIGLMMLLFSLPIIIDLAISDAIAISISNNSQLTEANKDASLFLVQIIKHGVLIPCFIIFGLGISGFLRVLRSIVFGEGVMFFSDFSKGIKQNYKQISISFLILGILNFVSMIIMNLKMEGFQRFVLYLPLFVTLFLIFPPMIIGFYMVNLYSNSYFANLKASYYFYARYFLYYLIAFIFNIIPVLSLFIPIFIARYIAFIVLLIFILPVGLLWLNILCNYVFDRHINNTQFPELLRKGMAPLEKNNKLKSHI